MSIPLKKEVDLAYSKEELAVNDALVTALAVPAESLRARGAAMPVPRFGVAKTEPSIDVILDTGRDAGPDRRMDYSGSYGSFSSSMRPSLGT